MRGKGHRSISFSEVSTALTCEAKHAFRYTGHLSAGQTLSVKELATKLSEGRAWGMAVAAWHSVPDTTEGRWYAHQTLRNAIYDEAMGNTIDSLPVDWMVLEGRTTRLGDILDHYMSLAAHMPMLHRLEEEIEVPLPSSGGIRVSNRYRFHGFVDGFILDPSGNEWIVEFKLHGRIDSADQIQRYRQIRWYAWARAEVTGRPVVGVILDERLNEAPKPPRIVKKKGKRDEYTVSHAANQLTTPEAYKQACAEWEVEPHPDTVVSLEMRGWQHRVPILFRPDELYEGARELVSAAKLIRDLDSGDRYPIRNAQSFICNGCDFKSICSDPSDDLLINLLFTRGIPKRLKGAEEANSTSEARETASPLSRAS